MKTSKSIAAVVILFIITFLVMGATDLNHCPDDSIAQLKARISSLEQRVESLEKKLQTSTTKRSSAMTRPSRPSSPSRGQRLAQKRIQQYAILSCSSGAKVRAKPAEFV